MQFLFQNAIERYKDCPPPHYERREMGEVYRWVFADMADHRNFMPQYQRDPARFEHHTDQTRCLALALSFFDSSASAINRFRALHLQIGATVFKTLGSNLASGRIGLDDGVNSATDEQGHFSHHPYHTVDYATRFHIIEPLS